MCEEVRVAMALGERTPTLQPEALASRQLNCGRQREIDLGISLVFKNKLEILTVAISIMPRLRSESYLGTHIF